MNVFFNQKFKNNVKIQSFDNITDQKPLEADVDNQQHIHENQLNIDKESSGFQCERCGKMFSYAYYRDKHLKYTRCVDNGDRKFPCALCTRLNV